MQELHRNRDHKFLRPRLPNRYLAARVGNGQCNATRLHLLHDVDEHLLEPADDRFTLNHDGAQKL